MAGDEAEGMHAHDEDAEKAVLGILLLNGRDDAAEVRRRLQPEDFYYPHHQEVYRACIRLDDNGDPVEPAAVLSVLAATKRLAHIPDGPLFLSELVGSAPSPTSLTFYTNIVKDAAVRRAVAAVGIQAQQMARSGDETSPGALIESLRAQLDDLSTTHISSELPPFQEVIGTTLNEIQQLQTHGALVGVGTGFTELDEQLSGLQPGQMIIIAARPGLGKSALALDFARHAAIRQDKSVLFFSLEMSHTELGMRALAAEAYVDAKKLRAQGALTDPEWEKLTQASQRMYNKKLGIDDAATSTIADIRAKALMWKRQHGLDLIVIDYLQLMNPVVRSPSRQQEVSEISRAVKLLAKELAVPVVALSQLNRGPEQRQDKKPVISDLRESGSLEQDADVVLLLHREDAYDRESPRAGEADLIIAKQRSGPTGQITLSWLGKFSRFDNREMF